MKPAHDPRLSDYGAVLEAMRHLKKELDGSLRAHSDLNLVWFEALLRIERAGGAMTMGTLAEQTLLSSGGVTRLVDRLAEHGYATRRACEEDRRVQYVEITDEGRAVLDAALAVHVDDLQRAFFDHLEDDERATIVEAMTRVRGAGPICGRG